MPIERGKKKVKSKLRQIALISIIIPMLVGCQFIKPKVISSEHTVVFEENIKINVNDKNVDTTAFVRSIDSRTVSPTQIEGNKIYVQTATLECPTNVNTSKFGKIKLIYKIGKKTFIAYATVQDFKKPVISLSETEKTITIGDSWDIKDIPYEVTDNYSTKEKIKMSFEGTYDITKAGTYEIRLTATDEAGNWETETYKLTVKEKEKPKEDKQTSTNEGSKKSTNTKSKPSTSNSNTRSNTSNSSYKKSSVTASTKVFHFSDSSNMNQTYMKAIAYAKSQLTAGRANGYYVSPIQGADGIYTGYKVTFY